MVDSGVMPSFEPDAILDVGVSPSEDVKVTCIGIRTALDFARPLHIVNLLTNHWLGMPLAYPKIEPSPTSLRIGGGY